MNTQCFDIGAIQAFLDGETNNDLTLAITDHAADCDSCAALLAAAEEESSLVFSVLEREMNTLVPTQRLWTRINDSIETEREYSSVWRRLLSGVTTSLLNPSFAAAASIVIVFGLLAVIWNVNSGTGSIDSLAVVQDPPASGKMVPINASAEPADDNNSERSNGDVVFDPQPTFAVDDSRTKARIIRASIRSTRVPERNSGRVSEAAIATAQYLPGEESYVKTINDLKQNVDNDPGRPMSASSRVSYERDMAVVNDAIVKMKDVVRKDPQNQGAKQVLYASYQNKIDLLNSVAQREELMASIR